MGLWVLLIRYRVWRVVYYWRTFCWAAIAATLAIALSTSHIPTLAQVTPPEPLTPSTVSAPTSSQVLPPVPPRVHPLPGFAQPWPLVDDDYFGEIKTTSRGYLVWSNFPVKVYIDPPQELTERKSERWLKAVRRAIADWQVYFPLQEVTDPDAASIVIVPLLPPRNIQVDRENQRLIIPDLQRGRASYEFYTQLTDPPQIIQRFRVYLSPEQNAKHTRGTARHEIGHALGIWGHSPDSDDVMFEQQVYKPPEISDRDLSVLRRIYAQPTQLGWPVDLVAVTSP